MIKITINNEALDIEASALVTFKKSQQLNGIQNQYSYSNNFNIKNSSKNRRLLGINYLPNSKAKSMTKGYDVDVVLNGCIFLKRQKLKVQKETADSIPVYLIFTDSFLVSKAKEVLMNQLALGVVYTKNIIDFAIYNNDLNPLYRSAPISAQDKSGLIVVEEIPVLLNVKELLLKAFTQLGYAYTGDILTDENIGDYYTNSNVGVYGPDGTPRFGATMTVYDFILDFLETFNGYIEVSDSSRSLGLYLWKNIEGIKSDFVDYSAKFTGYTEYAFEGGLAKVNTINYSDSPDFYNGFFNNNKSIIDKTDYLTSDFGAGNLRLFADQDLEEDGSILPRAIGEVTEPQTMNLFRFEAALTSVPVYSNGLLSYQVLNKAFSPNILEIWQTFHRPYCDNIALPTIAQIKFRYDALFLANFKMAEVFFIKQLSTYWLPLELNFTSKKDGVRVKALMIEKTPVDVPIVYDQNLSVGFYGEVFILDIFALYAASNVSPAASTIITAADLTKNNIYVNGVQVLAFPSAFDVSSVFEFRVENIEAENVLSNSNVLFRFISEQGGQSREATINVAHNGRANFVSEFRSETDTVYTYTKNDTDGHNRVLNYAAKITSPINIADTFPPAIGDFDLHLATGPTELKVLEFDRASNVTVELTIGLLHLHCSNRGGGAEARTRVYFRLWKNGAGLLDVYSAGAIDRYKHSETNVDYPNVFASKTFSVNAGDVILIETFLELSEENRAGSGTMDGSVSMTNVIWKFKVTEQL
jgi:hypothetical protein